MRTEDPQPIRLSQYAPPAFQIDEAELSFQLDPHATRVSSALSVRRTGPNDAPLRLDGEGLTLQSVSINGRTLSGSEYTVDDAGLTIPGAPDDFTLEIENTCAPAENTALSGLYVSGGRLCTQCEAEGFRRITYYLDRPDVLARFTVRLEAEKAVYPTLVSNGNLESTGEAGHGRHFAQWRDPFPKPAYLFALVAGAFDLFEDSFTTMSGRVIPLKIYVDPGDADRAAYAMDALKRSMAWDETAFGREYDLDIFMVVAVRDFNFGAMENKGLNIFNSALLLADPQTATDADYEAIESVIAHEYFHNWTGNRITLRDWFQLCLKEGLTVFRDQEFSADQRGDAVQRIKDVQALRARQFPEDAGPLAHPVRPSSYMKIDNFYTATVYEKGAEVIRMLRALLGADAFARGMTLYFEMCDGTAATVEEFLACFEEASGRDLKPFMAWYAQAGTPHLRATTFWNANDGALTLTLAQDTPATPGQPNKTPVPIPVRLGFLTPDGEPAAARMDGEETLAAKERTIVLSDPVKSWRFTGFKDEPALSLLRGFSAPVILDLDEPRAHRALRARADSDLFNRWEAGQEVLRDALVSMAGLVRRGEERPRAPQDALAVIDAAVTHADADLAFAALAMSPPDEPEIARLVSEVDPAAIRLARKCFVADAAEALHAPLRALYDRLADHGTFSPDAHSAGRRAARGAALRLLMGLGAARGGELAHRHFDAADNMTDAIAGLVALDASGSERFDLALAAFYARWRDHPLVIDKWFAVQARSRREGAVARVRGLLDHPDYAGGATPNRVRAVLGAFAAGNLAGFHMPEGTGYGLFMDEVLKLDRRNPMLAARLLGLLEIWPRLEPRRRAAAKAALERTRRHDGASANLTEIAEKALAASD